MILPLLLGLQRSAGPRPQRAVRDDAPAFPEKALDLRPRQTARHPLLDARAEDLDRHTRVLVHGPRDRGRRNAGPARPAGCGKTTTLRLIAGLEQPDTGGRAFFDEIDVTGEGIEKRNVGMVFQFLRSCFDHERRRRTSATACACASSAMSSGANASPR